MNLYKVINEEISGNPVYVNENGKIYNSIFTFKDGVCHQIKNGLLRNENQLQGREM